MKSKGVSAVVLAGGNSTRMGQDKALLKLGHKTMIEIVVDTLRPLFQEIIVVTNHIKLYSMLEDVTFVPDRIKTQEKNSLVGLYTGLFEAQNEHVFVVACDMPLLNTTLIQHMVESLGEEDILIPYLEGHYQPLHAIYGKRCLDAMKRLLEKKDYKILNFFDEVVVKKVEEDVVRFLDPQLHSFVNVNTYQAYKKLNDLYTNEKR